MSSATYLRRPFLIGQTTYPYLSYPKIRCQIRRGSGAGLREYAELPGDGGITASMIVEVHPETEDYYVATVDVAVGHTTIDDVVDDINTALGAATQMTDPVTTPVASPATAYERDGYIWIECTVAGGGSHLIIKKPLDVPAREDLTSLLKFPAYPDPLATSTAGDLEDAPPSFLHNDNPNLDVVGNPVGTKLLASHEDLTSQSINRSLNALALNSDLVHAATTAELPLGWKRMQVDCEADGTFYVDIEDRVFVGLPDGFGTPIEGIQAAFRVSQRGYPAPFYIPNSDGREFPGRVVAVTGTAATAPANAVFPMTPSSAEQTGVYFEFDKSSGADGNILGLDFGLQGNHHMGAIGIAEIVNKTTVKLNSTCANGFDVELQSNTEDIDVKPGDIMTVASSGNITPFSNDGDWVVDQVLDDTTVTVKGRRGSRGELNDLGSGALGTVTFSTGGEFYTNPRVWLWPPIYEDAEVDIWYLSADSLNDADAALIGHGEGGHETDYYRQIETLFMDTYHNPHFRQSVEGVALIGSKTKWLHPMEYWFDMEHVGEHGTSNGIDDNADLLTGVYTHHLITPTTIVTKTVYPFGVADEPNEGPKIVVQAAVPETGESDISQIEVLDYDGEVTIGMTGDGDVNAARDVTAGRDVLAEDDVIAGDYVLSTAGRIGCVEDDVHLTFYDKTSGVQDSTNDYIPMTEVDDGILTGPQDNRVPASLVTVINELYRTRTYNKGFRGILQSAMLEDYADTDPVDVGFPAGPYIDGVGTFCYVSVGNSQIEPVWSVGDWVQTRATFDSTVNQGDPDDVQADYEVAQITYVVNFEGRDYLFLSAALPIMEANFILPLQASDQEARVGNILILDDASSNPLHTSFTDWAFIGTGALVYSKYFDWDLQGGAYGAANYLPGGPFGASLSKPYIGKPSTFSDGTDGANPTNGSTDDVDSFSSVDGVHKVGDFFQFYFPSGDGVEAADHPCLHPHVGPVTTYNNNYMTYNGAFVGQAISDDLSEADDALHRRLVVFRVIADDDDNTELQGSLVVSLDLDGTYVDGTETKYTVCAFVANITGFPYADGDEEVAAFLSHGGHEVDTKSEPEDEGKGALGE